MYVGVAVDFACRCLQNLGTYNCDGTVALAANGTQEQLYNAFDSGNPLTIGIYLDENTYFEGTGYVQSFNIDAAPDDKINLSCSIAGSGATTLTLPSA